jgi:hypothetical protein
MQDVLAPVSTLALMAGNPISGNAHHSNAVEEHVDMFEEQFYDGGSPRFLD